VLFVFFFWHFFEQSSRWVLPKKNLFQNYLSSRKDAKNAKEKEKVGFCMIIKPKLIQE